MAIRKPGPLDGWNPLARSGGQLKILDEATHTFTGGSPTEVINLGITISNTAKVLCVGISKGVESGQNYGVAYNLTSSTQITARSAKDSANLIAGNRFHYQILKVPSGHVERGSDTIAISLGWAEYELDLVAPVNLSKCQSRLNHLGTWIWSNAGGTVACSGGYVKAHGSDTSKLLANLYREGVSAGNAVIYWEVWSP